MKKQFELFATYNKWINANLFMAAARLDAEEIARDRGAYFGSVLGTLNHIVVADTIWLKRFSVHPSCRAPLQQIIELPEPTGLNQILFDDFNELRFRRTWLDEQICNWISGLSETDLDYKLEYLNTKGIPACKRFSSLLLHFFNHQSHHRGQVTTLLSQSGVDPGVTDMLAIIPNENG